jgi:hypothetical protein
VQDEKSDADATPMPARVAEGLGGAYYPPQAVLQRLGQAVAPGTRDDGVARCAGDPVLGNPPFGVSE